MRLDHGHSYRYVLPPQLPAGDNGSTPFRSRARLFENGVELGPEHTQHDQIRIQGNGCFCHWEDHLYFSCSDNSSPFTNFRSYHLLVPASMFAPDDIMVALRWAGLAYNERSPLERFSLARRLYRKIWSDTPLPDHDRLIDHDRDFAREFARLSPADDVTYERKYNLEQLSQLVLDVNGDMAECGVYKGGSAFLLARQIVARRLNKRLCLFDSFEGLSVPEGLDGDHWQAGALSSTTGDVQAALAPLGPLPTVEFYKGWIPSRFAEVADRRFCFVHIDVDLYQPTLDSLAFFYPRMEPGGIILLDDYGFGTCPGATAAVDAFMADKPEPVINLSAGGGFIIKKRGSSR